MHKINVKELIKLDNKFDGFLTSYDTKIPMILYGFGGGIMGIPEIFKTNGIEILAVCDRDKSKHGSFVNGIEVMPFEEAIEQFNEFNVYITVSNYFDEIRAFLKTYIPDTRIFGFGRKKNMTTDEYRDFLIKNEDRLINIQNQLSDEFSEKSMENVIYGSLTNDLNYFEDICVPDQYFPNDIVELGKNEVFIDAGAFNGDSIRSFLGKTENSFKQIYAFEPDAIHAKVIDKLSCEIQRKKDIKVFLKALYESSQNLTFDNDISRGAHITSENVNKSMVEAVSLDEVIREDVTFIKMDIEGCELKALKGSEVTIKKFKPKLAICIYHKYEDVLEIPEYIMSLGLDYKYYIRHHTMSVDETVFYAI